MIIKAGTDRIAGEVALPVSKSEANRGLILAALSEGQCQIEGSSEAHDSVLLEKLLKMPAGWLDCEDAGTTLRFLCACCCIRKGEWTLTGTRRMQQRPIGPLVDALRQLGADIEYLEQNGFPPLRIKGKKLKGGQVVLDSGLSSQYASALLMIGPVLPEGLSLKLKGPRISAGYMDLTLRMMASAGVPVQSSSDGFEVPPGSYRGQIRLGMDYSAASYWFELLALSPEGGDLLLKGLHPGSGQPDEAVLSVFEHFGICSSFTEQGLRIQSGGSLSHELKRFDCDFSGQPDLAQTLACTMAGLGAAGRLSGLGSLRIKETDRIRALKAELLKLGLTVQEGKDWLIFDGSRVHLQSQPLETHQDHRMAMSLAPLALVLGELELLHPEVVKKSYPQFWEEMSHFFELIV